MTLLLHLHHHHVGGSAIINLGTGAVRPGQPPPSSRSVSAAAGKRGSSSGEKDSLRGLASAMRGFKGAARTSSTKDGSRRERRGGKPVGGDNNSNINTASSSPHKPPPSTRGFNSSTSSSSSKRRSGSFSDEDSSTTTTTRRAGRRGSSSRIDDDERNGISILENLSDAEVAEILGEDTAGPDSLAGVDPILESNLATVLSEFSFPFDAFQVKAVRHILNGRSVVVCAPTGAGKTAIAEAASSHFLRAGQRVIYTTPLKALSNQKLGEMRQRFGVTAAGLQTGDASINPDGSVVVMTTEILRNMLYRTEDEAGSTAASSADRLQDVSLVVLDECHYLGDPGRGSVWEEVIINMPSHIQILAMSATVRNPADLAGWITAVHGECDLVQTSFRPVPLTWQYVLTPGDKKVSMLPLLNEKQRGINPDLLPPAARLAAAAKERRAAEEEEDFETGTWGRVDNEDKIKKKEGIRVRTLSELLEGFEDDFESDDDWHKIPRWQRIPSIEGVVATLAEKEMLPAIWFIFSRKECEASVHRLASTQKLVLTTESERAEIMKEVAALQRDQPESVKPSAVPALAAGLASHHAGCLPGWKALVERLYQRGFVKVVFATETLAAGINMPARTTLLSALSRRRDNGIALLTHNELLQMAGRAGRRGYDTQGHCVVVQSKWEDPETAYEIIRKGPEPLRSQFTTNYGMALNLLWSRSMNEAREFLDRSYARHLSGAGAARIKGEIAKLESKAQKVLDEAARKPGKSATNATASRNTSMTMTTSDGSSSGADDDDDDDGGGGSSSEDSSAGAGGAFPAWEEDIWSRYQKLQGRRREEKRAARLLRSQLSQERGCMADAVLAELGLPRAVGLDISGTNIDDSSYLLPALVVARLNTTSDTSNNSSSRSGIGSGQYLCLGADNMVYVVNARHISAYSEMFGISSSPTIYSSSFEVNEIANGDDGVQVFLKLAVAAVVQHAQSLPRRTTWNETGSGVAIVEGSAGTAASAVCLPLSSDLLPLQPSAEGLEALRQQRVRVTAVKNELDAMQRDKRFARASKRYARAAAKAEVLLDRAATLKAELEGRLDGGWREFESIVNVLEAAGAFEVVNGGGGGGGGGSSSSNVHRTAAMVETTPPPLDSASSSSSSPSTDQTQQQTSPQQKEGEDRRRFTPLGLVAREVRGSNELWLATALTHEALQSLAAPQLAAVVSALVAADAVNRANVEIAYPPSAAVIAAVEALEPARAEMAALQARAGLDLPVGIDLRLSGIVEGWASGLSWGDITADCGLDDGDVARLLMRTVDTLRQAGYCTHLLRPLRTSARAAASAMNRNPISDLVA